MRTKRSYKAKIELIQLQFAQKGISIEGVLSIPTRRQATNETHGFRMDYCGNPNSKLFLLHALWKFRRDALEFGEKMQSEPGDHDLSPSNFWPGFLWT